MKEFYFATNDCSLGFCFNWFSGRFFCQPCLIGVLELVSDAKSASSKRPTFDIHQVCFGKIPHEFPLPIFMSPQLNYLVWFFLPSDRKLKLIKIGWPIIIMSKVVWLTPSNVSFTFFPDSCPIGTMQQLASGQPSLQ